VEITPVIQTASRVSILRNENDEEIEEEEKKKE